MDALCRLIASFDLETLMPIIPCRCFIGIDHRLLRDRGANERSNLAFRIENCGDGIAVSHRDNPELAALVPGSRGRVLTIALAASRAIVSALVQLGWRRRRSPSHFFWTQYSPGVDRPHTEKPQAPGGGAWGCHCASSGGGCDDRNGIRRERFLRLRGSAPPALEGALLSSDSSKVISDSNPRATKWFCPLPARDGLFQSPISISRDSFCGL
jgi:hypothetical protein